MNSVQQSDKIKTLVELHRISYLISQDIIKKNKMLESSILLYEKYK